MSNESEAGGSGDVVEQGAESTAMNEVLQGRIAEADQALEALRTDPDVAAVLAAKAANKPLRMTIGEGEPADDAVIPDPSELDSMTNTQVVALMQRVLPKAVATQTQALTDEVAALKAELAGGRKEKLVTQVEALQVKYPDLAEYKETILKLAPMGLSVEEAYIVGRNRSGKGLPTPKARVIETSVERPSSVTIRPAEKTAPAKQGSQGFKADLQEALDRIDFKG